MENMKNVFDYYSEMVCEDDMKKEPNNENDKMFEVENEPKEQTEELKDGE